MPLFDPFQTSSNQRTMNKGVGMARTGGNVYSLTKKPFPYRKRYKNKMKDWWSKKEPLSSKLRSGVTAQTGHSGLSQGATITTSFGTQELKNQGTNPFASKIKKAQQIRGLI